ncbi:MAG: MBL fold metallo-hydrolase [Nanoarchaeales archaeon]|nr:MBL fold metallo-hydrolase [Nanoarchaeales archaeon]
MKIIFHGAAQEVGKSCIEVQTGGKRYIMDAGIKFTKNGAEYPKFLDRVFELDGVFLSHAHLDHSGALPLLEHKNLKCPIYCTNLTWKIVNLLLADNYHLEKLKHIHPAYVERDITKVKNDLHFVTYDKQYVTGDGKVKFTYLNSGHIPGGASILLELEGKKLLYTADINTEDTNLMIPSNLDEIQDIDILITENTYGNREHPGKDEEEKKFLEYVRETIKGGGSVLVPAFAVGRSQEVLILLEQLEEHIPIYLDGMARKVMTMVAESDDKYIDNRDAVARMMKRVRYIKKPTERDHIGKMKGIVIVTTSGMCQGGPVMTYLKHFVGRTENRVIMTGYQAAGTNGRYILEERTFKEHHHMYKVICDIQQVDFSAHYGQSEIRKMMTKINPAHLILQHGDISSLTESLEFAKENIDGEVYMPEIGEVMTFYEDE